MNGTSGNRLVCDFDKIVCKLIPYYSINEIFHIESIWREQ